MTTHTLGSISGTRLKLAARITAAQAAGPHRVMELSDLQESAALEATIAGRVARLATGVIADFRTDSAPQEDTVSKLALIFCRDAGAEVMYRTAR